MKIKNEKEIFDLFVEEEDSMRDVLKTPFIPEHDGRVWASDSYILIMVNPDCVLGKYEMIKDFGRDLPVREYNCNKPLLVSDLQDALKRCPQEPEMKIKSVEVVECPECKGTGVVTAAYEADYDNHLYDIDVDCPICDGEGTIEKEELEPTGNMIPKEGSLIKLGKSYFKWYYIDTIIETCKILKIEKIKLVRTSTTWMNIFELSSDIHICLMPMFDNGRDKRFKSAIEVKFTK